MLYVYIYIYVCVEINSWHKTNNRNIDRINE